MIWLIIGLIVFFGAHLQRRLLPETRIRLNNQLGDNQYLLGQEFSLADIPAGCWYNRCLKLDFDLSSFKGISAWGARLAKRKAFQNSIINAPMPPN